MMWMIRRFLRYSAAWSTGEITKEKGEKKRKEEEEEEEEET